MTHAHVTAPNRARASAARTDEHDESSGASTTVQRMPIAVPGLVSAPTIRRDDDRAPVIRRDLDDGAPVIRRDFDFVGKGMWAEPINFEADVVTAIDRSKKFAESIKAVKTAIAKIKTASVKETAETEIEGFEEFIALWDGVKVPLAKRAEVVARIGTITERLSAMSEDYATKDKNAVAKAKADAEEQRKREAEKRKQEAEDAKKKREDEARQEEARKQAAAQRAAQKIVDDRSALTSRNVLGEAEAAAKEQADEDTAFTKNLAGREAELAGKRGATKSQKENAEKLKQDLAREVADSTNRSMGVLADFARSPEGMALSDADLRLVIQTAGPDAGRASTLVTVLNASGTDRTVAAGFSTVSKGDFAEVAKHCLTLFGKGLAPAAVLMGAKEMAEYDDVSAYLTSAAGPVAANYLALPIEGPHELKAALVASLHSQPSSSAYTVQVARRLHDGLKSKTVTPQTIAWLISLSGTTEFAGLVALFIENGIDVEDVRGAFAASGYTAAETLGLVQRHKAALPALTSVIGDAQTGCPGYTDLVMSTRHLAAFAQPQQRAALRAEALLSAGMAGVTVRTFQGPRDFGRGDDNPFQGNNITRDAKTGFVRLVFAAPAQTHEVHTHWFQADGQGVITSMHVVTGGVNGIEIQTRTEIPTLVARVVAAHNADNRYVKPQGHDFRV